MAAALALSIILPNVSPGTAMAMANIPLIGKYFQVVTVRDFQYDENNKLADVKIPQVDTAQAQGINREIEAYTNQLLEEFKEDVEAGGDNFRELSVSYEVTMDTDIWFTLRISAFEAQGGGANQVKYYHIDNLDEHGKLFCNSPLIGKGTECKRDKHRKDRNYHLGDNGQHNLLELLQHLSNHRGLGPCGGQAPRPTQAGREN